MGSCDYGTEHSVSKKDGIFFDEVNDDHQFRLTPYHEIQITAASLTVSPN
jgi:hypothetical protein